MINVKSKRCQHSGCNTLASYGLSGNGVTHCSKHKQKNQLSNPNKKCEIKKCKDLALYNNNEKTPKRCEKHKLENDVNLVERECKKCDIIEVLNEDDFCTYCDEKKFFGFKLGKQREIKCWLELNEYKFISYDTALLYNECDLKLRPDFVFDCEFYKVVLEVDEHAHGNNNEVCECTRMINISQGFTIPTIFIRYNPDKFYKTLKNGSKKQYDPSKNKRLNTLKSWLDKLLNLTISDIKSYGYCSFIQLYYNEFNISKTFVETVNSFSKQ
jgi:hypothetical protein